MNANDSNATCDPISQSIPAILELPSGATVEGSFLKENHNDAYFVPPRRDGESDEEWQSRWEWIRALEKSA